MTRNIDHGRTCRSRVAIIRVNPLNYSLILPRHLLLRWLLNFRNGRVGVEATRSSLMPGVRRHPGKLKQLTILTRSSQTVYCSRNVSSVPISDLANDVISSHAMVTLYIN